MEKQYIPITHKKLFPYTRTLISYSGLYGNRLFGKFTFKNQSKRIFNNLRLCRKPSECDFNINFDDYSSNGKTIRNKRIFKQYSSFLEDNSGKLYAEYPTQKLNFASISIKYDRNRL